MAVLKKRLLFIAGTIALLGGAIVLLERAFAAPGYSGSPSEHFDGEKFRNIEPLSHAEGSSFLKWQLTREPGDWREWVDDVPGPAPPERVAKGEMRVTFVNHATILIQIDGVNILTDPIWSERCSPVSFAGPKRVRVPGIRFEDLPPIDVVVVSHNHYDHFDIPTLQRLEELHEPVILVGLGNDGLLQRWSVRGGVELDWWESHEMDGLEITFVPAQHFSARAVTDRDRNLWGGWVIRGSNGYAYFAGDTGWGGHFEEIRERFGSPRVALLPIGAFLPEWFMSPVHISPAEAIEAHRVLVSNLTIPMHFGTFQLGDDGEHEAIDALREIVSEERVSGIRVLAFGEGVDVSPLTVEP